MHGKLPKIARPEEAALSSGFQMREAGYASLKR